MFSLYSPTYFTPAAVAVIVTVSPVGSVKTFPLASAATAVLSYVTVYTSSVCVSPSYSQLFVEDPITSALLDWVIVSVPGT